MCTLAAKLLEFLNIDIDTAFIAKCLLLQLHSLGIFVNQTAVFEDNLLRHFNKEPSYRFLTNARKRRKSKLSNPTSLNYPDISALGSPVCCFQFKVGQLARSGVIMFILL